MAIMKEMAAGGEGADGDGPSRPRGHLSRSQTTLHGPAARAFRKRRCINRDLATRPLSTNLKDALALEKLVKRDDGAAGRLKPSRIHYTGLSQWCGMRGRSVADGRTSAHCACAVEYAARMADRGRSRGRPGRSRRRVGTDPKTIGRGFATAISGTHGTIARHCVGARAPKSAVADVMSTTFRSKGRQWSMTMYTCCSATVAGAKGMAMGERQHQWRSEREQCEASGAPTAQQGGHGMAQGAPQTISMVSLWASSPRSCGPADTRRPPNCVGPDRVTRVIPPGHSRGLTAQGLRQHSTTVRRPSDPCIARSEEESPGP